MQLTHSTMIKHTSPHLHLPLHMDRLGGSPSGAKKRVFEFLNKLRIKNHTIPHSQPSQPGLVVTVIIIIVVFLFSIINHRWHESYSHNLNIQIFNPNFSTLVIILTRKTNQLPIHQPPYLKPPLLDPDHPLSPPLSTPRLNHSLEIYGNLYKKSEISYALGRNPFEKWESSYSKCWNNLPLGVHPVLLTRWGIILWARCPQRAIFYRTAKPAYKMKSFGSEDRE